MTEQLTPRQVLFALRRADREARTGVPDEVRKRDEAMREQDKRFVERMYQLHPELWRP